MNTPEPCVRCDHLYWNCMDEDDPSAGAECKKGLPMGLANCPEFSEEMVYTGIRDPGGNCPRLQECLAAERAAAQLREDAKYKARWERLRRHVSGMARGEITTLMDRLEKEG